MACQHQQFRSIWKPYSWFSLTWSTCSHVFQRKQRKRLGRGGGLNGLRDIFIIYKDDWVGKKWMGFEKFSFCGNRHCVIFLIKQSDQVLSKCWLNPKTGVEMGLSYLLRTTRGTTVINCIIIEIHPINCVLKGLSHQQHSVTVIMLLQTFFFLVAGKESNWKKRRNGWRHSRVFCVSV